MGYTRQEYWNGLPFHFPGDLPDPGIEPTSPALAGMLFTTEPPGKPYTSIKKKERGKEEDEKTKEVLGGKKRTPEDFN